MKPWLTTNPYGPKGINLRRGPIHWRSPPRQQEISPFQTACMVNCLPVNCPPQKHTSRVRRVVKLASLTPPPLLFCHTKKRKGNEWRGDLLFRILGRSLSLSSKRRSAIGEGRSYSLRQVIVGGGRGGEAAAAGCKDNGARPGENEITSLKVVSTLVRYGVHGDPMIL